MRLLTGMELGTFAEKTFFRLCIVYGGVEKSNDTLPGDRFE